MAFHEFVRHRRVATGADDIHQRFFVKAEIAGSRRRELQNRFPEWFAKLNCNACFEVVGGFNSDLLGLEAQRFHFANSYSSGWHDCLSRHINFYVICRIHGALAACQFWTALFQGEARRIAANIAKLPSLSGK
jgi:hypothetical protein